MTKEKEFKLLQRIGHAFASLVEMADDEQLDKLANLLAEIEPGLGERVLALAEAYNL